MCGAAGAVPISLLYGYDLFEKFLEVSMLALLNSWRGPNHILILSMIYNQNLGRSVNGSTLRQCTNARKYSYNHGIIRRVELIIYGI